MQNVKGATAKVAAGPMSGDLSRRLMHVVDDATKDALASLGLEAFRFDADYCPAEGWMRVKVKIRPVGRSTE